MTNGRMAIVRINRGNDRPSIVMMNRLLMSLIQLLSVTICISPARP